MRLQLCYCMMTAALVLFFVTTTGQEYVLFYFKPFLYGGASAPVRLVEASCEHIFVQEMSSAGQQVRVRFVTEYDEFRIVDSPFAVPSKLGRHGLSEVVNHLLEQSEHQPFDFLIQGKLVRVPLAKFIANNRLSTEEIIVIEYFPAASLSDESENIDAPSWVGAIDSSSTLVVSGCYNGQLKFYDQTTMAEIGSLQAHEDPIRAVLCWEGKATEPAKSKGKATSSGAKQYVATASKDNTVKVWAGSITSGAASFQLVATLLGHMSSVESLGRWASKDRLLSGDWAGNLYAWDLAALSHAQTQGGEQDGTARKRRKNSEGDVTSTTGATELKPLFTIKAHGQSVSGISAVDATGTVLTCSWDHSLKAWDLERQDCVSTMACSKVFTSLHRSAVGQGSSVLTSHPDGKVRLWELQAGQEASSAVATFGKSAQWISQVRWMPGSAHMFAATDFAGAVTLWDTRSPNVPLGSSEAHGGKALCLHWLQGAAEGSSVFRLLSGGSDCCMKVTAVDSASGKATGEAMEGADE